MPAPDTNRPRIELVAQRSQASTRSGPVVSNGFTRSGDSGLIGSVDRRDLKVPDVANEGHRRRLVFFICAIALFMGTMDSTIVATALPRIGAALHTPVNWTGWTITIYSLGLIIAMPLAGKISDQFGRKRIFLICIALFTGSSLVAGLSTSIYMLIPLRFIQALGGGAFMPSASGIVADHFGQDRDRAIGMFSSVSPIGLICGPIFGGVIAEYWTWRGIFFINVPIGIVLIVLAVKFIPRNAPRDTTRFDFPGVGMLTGTIVAGMVAVATLGEQSMSLSNVRVLGPFGIALIFGWLFVRHARRSDAPVVPIRMLRGKGFGAVNFLNLLYGSAVMGYGALAPLYAENRYHIRISAAGTLMSARAVASATVAIGATMLLRRIGYRLPMTIGFLTVAAGLVMLSIAPRGIAPYWWLTLFSFVSGLGLGCAAPATNNATMQLAPDQVAAISGLRGMFRFSGGIIYISITTSVLARSTHPGIAQAHIFLIQALILTAMTLLVYRVPDHRGRW